MRAQAVVLQRGPGGRGRGRGGREGRVRKDLGDSGQPLKLGFPVSSPGPLLPC